MTFDDDVDLHSIERMPVEEILEEDEPNKNFITDPDLELHNQDSYDSQYEKEYWEFVDDYEDSEREKRLQKDLDIDQGSCYEPGETREDTDYHYAEHFAQRFGTDLELRSKEI